VREANNFISSSYNLSLNVHNLTTIISKRNYTTTTSHNAPLEVNKLGLNEPIKFFSLEQACEVIKFEYLGVSGVYKLTSKKNQDRFYIGSSNNLARRMEEYNKLTKGLRNPHSSSELEISKTSASD